MKNKKDNKFSRYCKGFLSYSFFIGFSSIIFLSFLPSRREMKPISLFPDSTKSYCLIRKIIFLSEKKMDSVQCISLLIADTLEPKSLIESKERLKFLTDILIQYQTSAAQIQMSHETDRLQTRISFIALYAIILTFFIKIRGKKYGLLITFIAFAFFISFSFHDIHTTDLDSRHFYKKGCKDLTINNLLKTPNDSTLYRLFEEKLIHIEGKLHNQSRDRKLRNFFRPDLSQIVFYYMPITVLLGLYSFKKQKKPKKGKTNKVKPKEGPPSLTSITPPH